MDQQPHCVPDPRIQHQQHTCCQGLQLCQWKHHHVPHCRRSHRRFLPRQLLCHLGFLSHFPPGTFLPILIITPLSPFFSITLLLSSPTLQGTFLILLTAAVHQLRPPPCETGSSLCRNPSGIQLAVLYTGLALASLGNAGTRFTIATIGSDQFSNQKHQRVFFNWYIIAMYMSGVISSTAIVYVEDNVSWTLGFSLSAAANVVGLAVFLSGRRFYRVVKPQGSPFTNLARVVVAATCRRQLILSEKAEDYHHGELSRTSGVNPTQFFR